MPPVLCVEWTSNCSEKTLSPCMEQSVQKCTLLENIIRTQKKNGCFISQWYLMFISSNSVHYHRGLRETYCACYWKFKLISFQNEQRVEILFQCSLQNRDQTVTQWNSSSTPTMPGTSRNGWYRDILFAQDLVFTHLMRSRFFDSRKTRSFGNILWQNPECVVQWKTCKNITC